MVPAYRELLATARSEGVPVRSLHAGQDLAMGKLQLHVLAPATGYRPGAQPANNDSLVLRASYKDSSVLLMGDAEAPEEKSILASLGADGTSSLESTLLKIGHHGSVTSTQPIFLAAVRPSWAVLSCGRRNRFGHPRPEILAELQGEHTRTFRTDIDGATCFLLDGQSGPGAVTPQAMCKPDP
jgi:competence protein ComEC